jgi:hypothetical protein
MKSAAKDKSVLRKTEKRSSKLINDRLSLQAGFKTALVANLMKIDLGS